MPEPHRARPHLSRGLDAALSAVTKWRRGSVASGSPRSRLGASVLCARASRPASRTLEVLASVACVRGPCRERLRSLSPSPPP